MNDSPAMTIASSTPDTITGGGEMGRRLRAHPWARTALGPAEHWPQPLKTLVGVMLASNQAMFVAWGPERTLLYNDAYAEILAGKHPGALGRPFLEVWHEIRADLEPIVAQAYAGEPVHMDDITLLMHRKGYPEETHFSFSYTPVRDETGEVAGFLCPCTEITGEVMAERRVRASEARLRFLGELDEALRASRGAPGAMLVAAELLAQRIGASRTAYADVDVDNDRFVIRDDYTAPGIASSAGTYSLDLFGPRASADMRSGCTLVVRDIGAELAADEGRETFLSIQIQAIVCCPLVKEGRLVAMMAVHQDRPRDWTNDEIALVEAVVERCWAHVERVGAEARLRDSEEFNRRILQSSADCIKVLDLDGHLEFMSEGGMCVMEVDDFGAIQGACWPEFWPDAERPKVTAAIEAAKQGGTGRFQGFATTAKGSPRWWDVAVTPITGADGRPDKLLSVSRDVTAAKIAEARLRDTEERYRIAARATNDAIWDWRIADGHVLWNEALRTLFGHAERDTDAAWWIEHIHPHDRARIDQEIHAVIDGDGTTWTAEYRFRRADGSFADVFDRGYVLREEAGRATRMIGAMQDLTERRDAGAALAASEERLRLAVENAEVGFWDVDVVNDVLIWPPRTKAMFGISADVPVTMQDFHDGLHPDDREATSAAFKGAADPERRALYDVEYRTIGKEDGLVRWVAAKGRGVFDETGRCLRVAGTAIDITARKRLDEQLRELNATLERRVAEAIADRDRTWNNARDLLLVVGTDGVFRAVNPAWTATLGWRADELVGRSFLDFIHPDDHPSSRGALASASVDVLPTYENRYRHKDGSYRWISWVAAPEGELIYASGRDVTAEKEREAELARAQEALRQSQKMEAVGQLTGGIAHDFNNMLAVVIGSLDLLGRRIGTGDARAKRYLDAAADGARRAALLTQRLLAFSRQQPLRPEAIDANKLVAGMSELIRGSLGSDIRLETVLASGLWRTHADPNQLENVLLNLAVNARDAMPDGGRLTIETANCHLDGRYTAAHLGVAAGQYVMVAVTDTGTGMPEEVIAKAFDPFFTTKEVGKGTGLGLSQVYGFVKQSGGHVKIYSEPGQGTTVKVYLPRLIGKGAETQAESTDDELPLGDSQEVVLVVEDEPTVRQFSVDALTELGYRVLEADGAATALRLLDAHPEIELLFTDVVMPDVNGRKLADEARRRRPDLRVLFTTGYTRNAVVHNGVLDPGVELIGKPFTIEELAAKVREVLDQPAS